MRTITDLVGNGEIHVAAIPDSDGRATAWAIRGPKRIVAVREVDTAENEDAFAFHRGGKPSTGKPIPVLDDGPCVRELAGNKHATKEKWPLEVL